jgi:hypothetical protein
VKEFVSHNYSNTFLLAFLGHIWGLRYIRFSKYGDLLNYKADSLKKTENAEYERILQPLIPIMQQKLRQIEKFLQRLTLSRLRRRIDREEGAMGRTR